MRESATLDKAHYRFVFNDDDKAAPTRSHLLYKSFAKGNFQLEIKQPNESLTIF